MMSEEKKESEELKKLFDGIKVCDHINFNLRRGEVLGISGLMGAGRAELAMSIFGRSYGTNIRWRIFKDGKEARHHNDFEAAGHAAFRFGDGHNRRKICDPQRRLCGRRH